MEFKELFEQALTEKVEVDSNDWGFSADGEYVRVSVNKAKYNDLTELTIKGTRILGKIKSSEYVKGQYQEKDWVTIEKFYAKEMEQASKEVAKAVAIFEKSLEKTFKNLEKIAGNF